MKKYTFIHKVGFAGAGLLLAIRRERNLKIQISIAVGVIVVLALLKPEAVWWALAALSFGLVLAVEMCNTALEILADQLHPQMHPEIRAAKDVAAGAVLIASCSALAIVAAFLISRI